MKFIIVTGMPRSGTSWLGQIINSHPKVRFRTEPLFSYRFKNIIDESATCVEINNFLNSLVNVNDDFILQRDKLTLGHYPVFQKNGADVIAFKTTRHHELLDRYLECVDNIEVVAIVRHPCGAINSWFKSYEEFDKKGCKKERDWRTGACRKNEVGEYWGFNDWLSTTKKFMEMSKQYKNFTVVRYLDFVQSPLKYTHSLFDKLSLSMGTQTITFLQESRARHDTDPYSVYKDRSVISNWKVELDEAISDEIIRDTAAHGLKFFLE